MSCNVCSNMEPGGIIPVNKKGECLACGENMKIKMHWDRQAAKGELSGTQDRIAKQLEMQSISNYVEDGMRVLDVGCGDGETIGFLLSKYRLDIQGVDFSSEMVARAMRRVCAYESGMVPIYTLDVKDLKQHYGGHDPFDLIYTERTLINLASWEEQRQAIIDIGALLKPGGMYLMCECFKEGLLDINRFREEVGLVAIKEPWHNRYLSQDEIIPDLKNIPGLMLEDRVDYSANYYFLSRVVNAYAAAQSAEAIDYNSPINRIALRLQTTNVCNRGQGQLWVWRKKYPPHEAKEEV